MAAPASAFTADTLAIDLNADGDAVITFDYSLSWVEYLAVYLKIGSPSEKLSKAFAGHSDRPVSVIAADEQSMRFVVSGYAQAVAGEDGMTYTTPTLSFAGAQKILDEYWFAPLISPDFSPETTVVTFPDGTEEVFTNQITIPALTHTVTA